jgi:hypothetical protein
MKKEISNLTKGKPLAFMSKIQEMLDNKATEKYKALKPVIAKRLVNESFLEEAKVFKDPKNPRDAYQIGKNSHNEIVIKSGKDIKGYYGLNFSIYFDKSDFSDVISLEDKETLNITSSYDRDKYKVSRNGDLIKIDSSPSFVMYANLNDLLKFAKIPC